MNPLPTEETLDPTDWESVRKLGHTMLDEMIDHLQHIRSKPAWKEIPADVKKQFNRTLAEEGEGLGRAYEDFRTLVLPYSVANTHPRFWGWVKGTGSVNGMLSEMLAAALNLNDAGFQVASSFVEQQVIQWIKTLLGYHPDASGILLSGGSTANLVGLTVARNAKIGFDVLDAGLQSKQSTYRFYGSVETHYSVEKGIQLLGLGRNAFKKIPVDKDFRIDLAALKNAIREDRSMGIVPICVVGNAGTVNTGAVDDLNALAEIAHAEGLWYHIDGAFGAWAAIVPALQGMVAGMNKADSLAFDLHKWMYMPYEVACCLVRDPQVHARSFAVSASYVVPTTRGYSSGPVRWNEHGLQLSRSFRALKVWMSLKADGAAKYRRLVKQNVDQARYLASLIEQSEDLELLAPVAMNVVCFRYVARGKGDGENNAINQEVLLRLHELGIAIPSSTTLNGKFAIRVANTNHRSKNEDFELLVKEVSRLGQEIAEGVKRK